MTSTLDGRLQAFALDAVKRQLAQLGAQNVADAAVLVADNASGEVLAYIGNSGAESSARYVDGVQAARQAGSTLKPFLYELAIEERLLTAASLLEDSPVNIVTPGGLYVPQNYDRDFKGMVSLRTALSSSLNVPAVRTLTLLGTDPFVERLRALGFDYVTQEGDYYGYSLALGSAEISLWQLANAYRTLAQGGVASPLRLVPGEAVHGMRVLDRAASFIVSDILADRLARSVTFGLANTLSTRYWAAVKTGTSKDMRDNWCVGFSARYHRGGVGRQLRRQRHVGRLRDQRRRAIVAGDHEPRECQRAEPAAAGSAGARAHDRDLRRATSSRRAKSGSCPVPPLARCWRRRPIRASPRSCTRRMGRSSRSIQTFPPIRSGSSFRRRRHRRARAGSSMGYRWPVRVRRSGRRSRVGTGSGCSTRAEGRSTASSSRSGAARSPPAHPYRLTEPREPM